MNESFAPYRRRIDPATEPPFELGDLYVSPATLEVRSGTTTTSVEPRVMQVLLALHQQANDAVTRDDLSQLCWGGLIVGEDALNRTISRLRKVLVADPRLAIDTIPKIGYRLRVEAPPPPAAARPLPRGHRRSWLAGLAALGAAGAVALSLLWPSPIWNAEGLRPLTREAGVETAPALSPGGDWLAYATAPSSVAPRDIHLRGVGVGDTGALPLTSTAADETSPAWSPDGRQLAFSRSVAGEPCAIIVMRPPRGAERITGRCRSDGETSLAWLGNERLVFADRERADRPRRLFALEVASGTVRPLTSPPSGSTGDTAPAVSPDGERLAFRRTAALGSDDVYSLDLRRGTERALTSDGWKALGLAWSPDSSALFISSNRRGDFGLWALDPDGRQPPQRVSLGLLPFSQMSADRQGHLAVQTSRLRAGLVALADGRAPAIVTRPAGIDWDPDVGPDGRLVYVSDAAGSAELWTQRPGRSPVRLTSFGGSFVHSPRWSVDGRRIAFIGVREGFSDVYVVEADGARLQRLAASRGAKGSVAWTGRGDELVITNRTGSGWRLQRLASPGVRPVDVPRAAGIVVVRRAPDGRLLGRPADAARVESIDPATGRRQPLAGAAVAEDREAWAPGRRGIYALRWAGTPGAELWLYPWQGAPRPIKRLATPPRPNLAVRPDEAVVVPQVVQDEADLMLLDLAKR